jgi:3-hydroxyisobutyrate dehydrogenase
MAKIGFVGTGNMGRVVIQRLLAAGHEVTAYNRTREKALGVEKAGARLVDTPGEVARGADFVFVSVTNDEASKQVWLGTGGILAAEAPRSVRMIECSTLSHDWVLELSREVTARGYRYIDCPVAGRPDAAEKGELRIFFGGPKEDLDALRPMLETFSRKIFHFGPVGAGTGYKLIYNLLGVVQVAAVAEAMLQCEAAGIDLHAAAEGFAIGYTGSRHTIEHSARMAEGKRNQPVGFPGSGRLKDALYGVRLAQKLHRQARTGEAAASVFQQMVDIGMGGLNDSELIDALREIAKRG